MKYVHTLLFELLNKWCIFLKYCFEEVNNFLEKNIYKNEGYKAIPLENCMHNL